MESKLRAINVTKTFLPLIEDYLFFLKEAWGSNYITNRGPLVSKLEERLKEYLNVSNILLTANGTIPIQIAIKALNLRGEIITTPFSYVATYSSIVWEGLSPKFVDINQDNLTIDASKIEVAINSKTTAILATHVYGNPCAIQEIEEIAKRHDLKVIYDAAHCFGVKYMGRSIFEFGDISTCSFHATKIFHTAEGGAIFCNLKDYRDVVFKKHNFGHDGLLNISDIGINGKMDEIRAALGLSILDHVPGLIQLRKNVFEHYLEKLNWQKIRMPEIRDSTDWNYSYFPIIFETEKLLLDVEAALNAQNIYPRRYFYPSLNQLNFVSYQEMPISESISKRVLCLPFHHDLNFEDVEIISNLINKILC